MFDTPGLFFGGSASLLEVIMSIETIFIDDNNTELRCYLNAKDKLYIGITDEDITTTIALDPDDAKELAKKIMIEIGRLGDD
jgi:hypothetical protein